MKKPKIVLHKSMLVALALAMAVWVAPMPVLAESEPEWPDSVHQSAAVYNPDSDEIFYFLAYYDYREGTDMAVGKLVDGRDGQVKRSKTYSLWNVFDPQLAYDPGYGQYLIVWPDYGGKVFYQYVDATDLEPLSLTTELCQACDAPSVAYDPVHGGFVLAYVEDGVLYAAYLTDGQVESRTVIDTTWPEMTIGSTKLVYTGGGPYPFFLTWQTACFYDYDLYGIGLGVNFGNGMPAIVKESESTLYGDMHEDSLAYAVASDGNGEAVVVWASDSSNLSVAKAVYGTPAVSELEFVPGYVDEFREYGYDRFESLQMVYDQALDRYSVIMERWSVYDESYVDIYGFSLTGDGEQDGEAILFKRHVGLNGVPKSALYYNEIEARTIYVLFVGYSPVPLTFGMPYQPPYAYNHPVYSYDYDSDTQTDRYVMVSVGNEEEPVLNIDLIEHSGQGSTLTKVGGLDTLSVESDDYAVVYGNGEHLVVWAKDGDLKGQYLGRSGVPISGKSFEITMDEGYILDFDLQYDPEHGAFVLALVNEWYDVQTFSFRQTVLAHVIEDAEPGEPFNLFDTEHYLIGLQLLKTEPGQMMVVSMMEGKYDLKFSAVIHRFGVTENHLVQSIGTTVFIPAVAYDQQVHRFRAGYDTARSRLLIGELNHSANHLVVQQIDMSEEDWVEDVIEILEPGNDEPVIEDFDLAADGVPGGDPVISWMYVDESGMPMITLRELGYFWESRGIGFQPFGKDNFYGNVKLVPGRNRLNVAFAWQSSDLLDGTLAFGLVPLLIDYGAELRLVDENNRIDIRDMIRYLQSQENHPHRGFLEAHIWEMMEAIETIYPKATILP